MRRTLPLLVLLALVYPATAGARTIVHGSDTEPFQSWIDGSQVPTPDLEVTVYPYENPACGDRACSRLDTLSVWIPANLGALQRWGFMHEIGHVFDNYVLRPHDRRDFEQIIGQAGDAWTDTQYSDSIGTPMEWFGDAYASCAVYGAVAPSATDVGLITHAGTPNWTGQSQACGLIDRAARVGTGASSTLAALCTCPSPPNRLPTGGRTPSASGAPGNVAGFA